MSLEYGDVVNGQRVGIEIIQTPGSVNSGTEHVDLLVRYYAEAVQQGFSENQTLIVSQAQSGVYPFNFTTPNGQTTQRLIITRTIRVEPSYAGPIELVFRAEIHGQSAGGMPILERTYTIPARPVGPPGRTGMPTISNITGSGFTFSWTPPGVDGGQPIQSYDWQAASDSGFSSVVQSGSVSSPTHVLTGLGPGESVYVRTRARNASGSGPWSSARLASSGASPSEPRNLNAIRIERNAISVDWDAPLTGTGISEYQFQWGRQSNFSDATSVTKGTRGHEVTGLAANTSYYFRSRATGTFGTGPWSDTLQVTTLASAGSRSPVPDFRSVARVQTSPVLTVRLTNMNWWGMNTGDWEWQFATNTAFTQNLIEGGQRQVRLFRGDIPITGFIYRTLELRTGVSIPSLGRWYVRIRHRRPSRSTDWSLWTEPRTFEIGHAPSVTVSSPSSSVFLPWQDRQDFTFRVTDSNAQDTVNAYRIEVQNNVTGATLIDTGKTSLANKPPIGNVKVSVDTASLPTTTPLRWRVMVWDSLDTPSEWSNWGSFNVTTPPETAVIYPESNSIINTGRPFFVWEPGLAPGRTLARTTLIVNEQESGLEVWRTTVEGEDTEYAPSQIILANGIIYTVTVVTEDDRGLQGVGYSTFTTNYVSPNAIYYDVHTGEVDSDGYVSIDWSNEPFDPDHISWNVYRREMPHGDWVKLASISDLGRPFYRDYLFETGTAYMYSVTQVVERQGAPLESPVGIVRIDDVDTAETRVMRPDSDQYWLLVPNQPEKSMIIPGVISDPSTLETETEMFHLIGRGRHVDYGDEVGYSGTLTFQIRQPEVQSTVRKNIEELVRIKELLYLRTPYGRTMSIALGDPDWDPLAGTGRAEMGDMTLPYFQVY